MNSITVFPNCKINLGLNIVERRPDGYHNLETIFYPIPLCDELTVSAGEKDALVVEGIPVDSDPMDNLVMKVVFLLRQEGFDIPPVDVVLKKNIPSGAGLGGGSSDAAYMMRALNELFELNLSVPQMESYVSRLGADCAFFIQNKPVYATGIGNVFTPIDLNLEGSTILLVKPDDFISTKEAYSMVEPHNPILSVNQIIKEPVSTWKERLTNDFERSAFPNHPTVQDIRDTLYQSGALYAAMSGSGSSVFGIFNKVIDIPESFSSHFTALFQL